MYFEHNKPNNLNVNIVSLTEESLKASSNLVFDSDLTAINQELESLSTKERIAIVLKLIPNLVMTSSFGIDAAVTLHLVSQIKPDIPVIFLDTQNHFPETYEYVERIKDQLNLNLKVYRSNLSQEEQIQKFGPIWEKGEAGERLYALVNKIEPLERAFRELGALGWIAGIRRDQSSSRADANIVELENNRVKFQPIVDWKDADIESYYQKHNLIRHPLWSQGFKRIGDLYTTNEFPPTWQEYNPYIASKRECGIHKRYSANEAKL
jgi:phosphoadenosine phosphosulfate reductase